MSLPRVAVLEDTVKLFGVKKPVRLRPYLVGEEKIFLTAQESGKQEDVRKAVCQVINRCTFDQVDAETLAFFDLEWVYLQLRSRSVSNVIETQFTCQNKVHPVQESGAVLAETVLCNTPVNVNIDINDIKLTVPEGHTNKVWLDDELGVTLKYPTASIDESLDFVAILQSLLETVFTKDGEVSEVSEQAPEEVREWVEKLTLTHVAKIKTGFFDTMPYLSYVVHFTCPKCGYKEDIVLQGLDSFFD